MEKRRRVGAYGVAHDEQGRVLLVRSSVRSNQPRSWYLPGGGLDHGEDPADGVRREFHEETGLAVKVVGVREVSADLVEFPWRGVLLHHDRIVYDVRVVGGTLAGELDGSTDLAQWVEPEQLPDLGLVPFAARALGLAAPQRNEVHVPDAPRPVAPDENGEVAMDGRALSGPMRVVRFGAYGRVQDPDGRILLSLISPNYPGGGRWHLPGGGTDFGEQPAAALIREIFEESGQVGRVQRVLAAGAHHNPAAVGPEGTPLDWYVVRSVFDVVVSNPTSPRVTEAAGGSTAEARWFSEAELNSLRLTELAHSVLLSVD